VVVYVSFLVAVGLAIALKLRKLAPLTAA